MSFQPPIVTRVEEFKEGYCRVVWRSDICGERVCKVGWGAAVPERVLECLYTGRFGGR